MADERRIRLSASAALREKRVATLLSGRDSLEQARLQEVVADAQLLGSLELAGFAPSWEQVRASRRGAAAPAPLTDLRRAQTAVDPAAPLSVAAIRAWHQAATGGRTGFRTAEAQRSDGPPPAPAAFIESRLASLEQWLGAESARELRPVQQGALALARIVEVLPFDDANGRVSRLAASHLMVRAGARPPILAAGDRERLRQALASAFQLVTEPLTTLLEEASERSLDVMIRTLEAGDASAL